MAVPVSKLNPKRCQLGVTTPRWFSSPLTTCGRVDTQAGSWKVSVGGHDPKMAFKSSHHLWLCQYPRSTLKDVGCGSRSHDSLQIFSPLVVVPVPKLDPKRCQLGFTTPRWPSCILTTCGRVGIEVGPWKVSVWGVCWYPSWTLKGVSWGSRPQDDMPVFHHLWPY